MRYPIALVNQGLKKLVEKSLIELREAVRADEDKLAAVPNSDARRQVVATALHRYADKLAHSTKLAADPYEVSSEVRRVVDKAVSGSGYLTTHEQDRLRRRIGDGKAALENNSTPWSQLHTFLELMAAAGETHVSAHGVKQAGYNPALLAHAMLAAQGVPNAQSAR